VRIARLALATAALAIVLAATAQAQIPFGANLNRPANANFDCRVMLLPDYLGRPSFAYPTNADTCTWMAAGTASNSSEATLVPPGRGTVVRIRVRVGPVTGPMQVVVLRGVRDPSSTGFPVCCRQVAQTGAFQPAPQAVTTINTALPVKKDVVPNPISNAVDFDAIALSVLAPGVPIPLSDTGNYAPLTAPIANSYYPAFGPGQERADYTGNVGFQVLLQGDWVPGIANAGAGQISLIQPVASVIRGNAIVSIACNQARPCLGFVRLGPSAIAGKKGKRPTYGKRKFKIKAHKTKKVKVSLTRSGRRLVSAKKRSKVGLVGTLDGKRNLATKITLKR
jgi:hypothetical protein